MNRLLVKKIAENAVIPSFAHPGDSGMDICSIEDKEILPGQTCLIRTGLIVELPTNTEAQIRPRSGLALKHSVTVLNAPGTIDEGYRGEIGVILINHGTSPFVVTRMMKIAQLVVKPTLPIEVVEIEELSTTSRADGGFGSTGI